MGRSVSTHRNAVATVYLEPEFQPSFEQEEWDDFLTDLRENVIPAIFPSMYAVDRWMDREDHIIMENQFAEISVSEYSGLVAICLAPRDNYEPLAAGWAERCADAFERKVSKMFKSSALISQGFMSNGGQVFRRVDN